MMSENEMAINSKLLDLVEHTLEERDREACAERESAVRPEFEEEDP